MKGNFLNSNFYKTPAQLFSRKIQLSKIDLNSPLFLVSVFLVLSISRIIYFGIQGLPGIVTVIPDDAFYYFQIASQRAYSGFWTFDGETTTTGFHLIYGYILFFIFEIYENVTLFEIYYLLSLASTLAIAFSIFLIALTIRDTLGSKYIIFGTLPFFTFPILNLNTSLMESWLVIFIASISVRLIFNKKCSSKRTFLGLFILGLMGSLSRTDYGMLPLVFTITIAILANRNLFEELRKSSITLFGAVIGLLISITHNYLLSGEISQSSAQTKLWWSEIAGHSIGTILRLTLMTSLPTYKLLNYFDLKLVFTILALFLVGLGLVLRKLWLNQLKRNEPSFVLLISSILTIFGYLLLYKFNSDAIQYWYAANLVVPCSIALAAMMSGLIQNFSRVFVTFLASVYFVGGILSLPRPTYPHQKFMMMAGIELKKLKINSKIGSWNAGIISYFSEAKIVNIDGLVNDEVLPYIKEGNLIEYLHFKNIEYLVDFDESFTLDNLRKRGGYDSKIFDSCIVKLNDLSDDGLSSSFTKISIWSVRKNCQK